MDTISTTGTGTTCYVRGERGVITGLHRAPGLHPRTIGVFVKLDERSAMLFVEVGSQVALCDCGRPDLGKAGHHPQCNLSRETPAKRHHEITAVREITRDDFDRITELDVLRRETGWAA